MTKKKDKVRNKQTHTTTTSFALLFMDGQLAQELFTASLSNSIQPLVEKPITRNATHDENHP
jgi:hypothetical protein